MKYYKLLISSLLTVLVPLLIYFNPGGSLRSNYINGTIYFVMSLILMIHSIYNIIQGDKKIINSFFLMISLIYILFIIFFFIFLENVSENGLISI